MQRKNRLAALALHNDYVRSRYKEIQSLKPTGVNEALGRIRETEPEVWRWVQSLELFNTKIWCDTCMATCADHEVTEKEFEDAQLGKKSVATPEETVANVIEELPPVVELVEQPMPIATKSKYAW
jgi:Pyruvate/2-oxoacid:ferredoxin oxidoreductase delta subunit